MRYRYVRAAGALVIAVGGLVLLGWWLDFTILKCVVPGLATMKPNTALAFILTGMSLCATGRWRRLGPACATGVLAIGALTLGQYATGVDLGIDQLLFRDSDGGRWPGRMAPATVCTFLALGAALSLLHAGRAALLAQTLASLSLLAAGLVLSGYLFGSEQMYRVPPFTSVALHTALLVALVSTAVLAATPDVGPVGLIASRGVGGILCRRVLPLAVLVPLLIGSLVQQGLRPGLYDTEFGLALFAMSNILVFAALVGWSANSLRVEEEGRRRSEDRFRTVVEAAPNGLALVGPDGRITLVNAHLLAMFGYSAEDELVGQPVEVLLPDRYRAGHPELRALFFASPEVRVIQAGRDLIGRRKDGSEFPVELWLRPIRMGERDSALASVVDVTDRRRMEQGLRASEERLRLAVEGAGMGTWDVSLPGGEGVWSPSALSIHGYEPVPGGVANYDMWARAIHPDDAGRVLRAVEEAKRDRTLYCPEHRIRRIDNGEVVWLRPFGRFHYDADGRPVRFVGVFFDDTARKKTEEALRRSEQLYRAIGESIDYGVWVCAPDGKNIYASPSFLRLVGISQEQCAEFGWGDVLHPDDAANTIAAWKECVRTRGKWDIEHRFRGADGQWHPVLARGVPVEDEEGRLTCWAGINLDISRLKAAETELRASEARFRQLIESLPQLVWTCQPDGRCDYLSRQWVEYTGAPEEVHLGYGWSEAVHPDDRDGSIRRWERSVATGEMLDVDYRLRDASGVYRWFKSRAVPFRAADGSIAKWFGTSTDIDEKKRAESILEGEVRRRTAALTAANERLRASVEEKEVLLREIHHRVKNNLQVISSLLQLQAHHSGSPAVGKLFQESQDRVRSMGLVHERLYHTSDLSRINFADYLGNLAGGLFRSYKIDHSQVKLRLETEGVFLGIDAAVPCGLIVNELVTNCLKYAFPDGRGGTVIVRLTRGDDEVRFEVIDDGVGLPAGVDPAAPKTFGLRLVADLTDQLRGQMRVSRDGGTAVRVTFPAARKKPTNGAP